MAKQTSREEPSRKRFRIDTDIHFQKRESLRSRIFEQKDGQKATTGSVQVLNAIASSSDQEEGHGTSQGHNSDVENPSDYDGEAEVAAPPAC